MRVLHRQLREHHPVLQPIQQLLDRRHLMRARKTEATKLHALCHDVLLGEFLREKRLEVLDGRLCHTGAGRRSAVSTW